MTWAIREDLKEMTAELPVEILEKIDRAVEYLHEMGQLYATRAHVVEFAIESQFACSAKAYVAFRRWKKEHEHLGVANNDRLE